ncbi:MAG TPA: hypothetical protein VF659_09970 [Pyrinomonadaceae bacterium]
MTLLVVLTGLLCLASLPAGPLELLRPTTAFAATSFTVNSTADAADADTADGVCDDGAGNCTLRAAVQQANATGGAHAIGFTVTGTVTLTSALPDITASVNVSGPGARRLTVSGNRANRVFVVAGGANVILSGLTISGGSAAGSAGLFNNGTLTVNECSITDNHATGNGGVGNCGTLASPAEKSALVASLGATPGDAQKRAAVLRSVADDADLRTAELNRAFVLMQYYGYLCRDPDEAPDADFRGWRFWLSKLEEFGGNYVRAEMVKAFISSDEYRNRFGR